MAVNQYDVLARNEQWDAESDLATTVSADDNDDNDDGNGSLACMELSAGESTGTIHLVGVFSRAPLGRRCVRLVDENA